MQIFENKYSFLRSLLFKKNVNLMIGRNVPVFEIAKKCYILPPL